MTKITRGVPLPDQITGHDLICVEMKIPDVPEYRAAFRGVLRLLETWNFWQKGDNLGAQAAGYWRQLIYDHLQIGTCEPMSNPIPAGLAVGMVVPYAGELPLPDGLLLCNGATYNAADYPELYSVINSFYKDTLNSTFTLPDMTYRTVVGARVNPIPASDFPFGKQDGEKTHTLIIDEIPAHTHTVPARDNATAFAASATLATSNQAGTVTTKTSGSMGGGAAHNNMPPYTALWWVIVAKTIQGGEPREIVMDSELILPNGDCTKIYWRYEDEPAASNRYLMTVCNGDDGTDGISPDCPDCDIEPTQGTGGVPQPPTAAEGSNARCQAATAISDYLMDLYIEAMQQYIIQIAQNGLSLLDLGQWIVENMPAMVGVTAATNLIALIGAWTAQDAQARLDAAQLAVNRETVKCHLDCLLLRRGDLTPEVYEEWRISIQQDASLLFGVDLSVFMSSVKLSALREVAHMAVTSNAASDCSSCDCGYCYRYFGIVNSQLMPLLDGLYVSSEPTSVGCTANTYDGVRQLQFCGALGNRRVKLRITVPANNLISRLRISLTTNDGISPYNGDKFVRDVTNSKDLFRRTANFTGTDNLDFQRVDTNEIEVDWNSVQGGTCNYIIIETTRALPAPKVSNC